MIVFDTPHKAKDAGYDEGRIPILNAHFEGMMRMDRIRAASYCLSRNNKVFACNALGALSYRDDDTRALQPDSLNSIASITKLFCATAVFKLVEDGKLRVSQKIGEFIEEFSHPPFDEIRIVHLLNHTSGLQADGRCFPNPHHMSPWAHIEQGFKNGDDNWIKNALKMGMRKKAGEEWAYCSFGFAVLGEIVSRVSGEAADEYITKNIIEPCGLNDTCFGDKLTPEKAKKLIVCDDHDEKQIDRILSGHTEMDEIEAKWSRIPPTAGGIYSTVMDLVTFGTMLLNGGTCAGNRILGRKTVERMISRSTSPDVRDYCWNAGGVERPYAYGPDLRNNLDVIYSPGTFFHEGAGACSLIVDPAEKFVAAYFVPFTQSGWHAQGMFNVSSIIWSGIE